MPTPPTPQQRKKLRDALISAFPERSSLEQLLYFELDKNLNQITKDSNLNVIVFELIKTAESEEWLEDLIDAARKENPRNSQLEVIARTLLSPSATSASTSAPSAQSQLIQQRILILAANPIGTSQLRLDEELREIEQGLRAARQREQFEIKSALAARSRDIHRSILEFKPQIVHFSGHGAGQDGLVFTDETGQTKLVDGVALARLFKLFKTSVNCVVLNACYSEIQARAIAQHINYVVGMSQAVGDRAAIEFAVGFYDALWAGESIEFAHELGCTLIQMQGISEQLTPKLLKKSITPPSVSEVNPPSNEIDDLSSDRNEQEAQKLQRQREQQQLEYENNLRRYEQEFAKAVQVEYLLNQAALQRLKTYQQQLGLNNEDVERVEQPIREPAEVNYQSELRQQAEQQRREQEAIKREQEQVILENQRRQAELKEQEQRKSSPPISNSDDDLNSARSIDYTRLRDLLAARNWKEADNETYLVMLKVVGRESGDWIRSEEFLNFPCTDLRTIDRLWVKYSNGRFGFSVQKKIYLEVGGKPDGQYYEEAWNKFGERVGWRKGWWMNKEWISYSEVTFDTSAPWGHLPISIHFFLENYITISSLASRLVNCSL